MFPLLRAASYIDIVSRIQKWRRREILRNVHHVLEVAAKSSHAERSPVAFNCLNRLPPLHRGKGEVREVRPVQCGNSVSAGVKLPIIAGRSQPIIAPADYGEYGTFQTGVDRILLDTAPRHEVSSDSVGRRSWQPQPCMGPLNHRTTMCTQSMPTPDAPPEIEEQILGPLLAPTPYSMPKPIPPPRIGVGGARKARQVFGRDGGAD